jgi:hypothetical protein
MEDGDWVATTPEGLFDGSEKGRQQVAYRIGGGLNVVPVDRFFQDFYHPGLYEEVILGKRPTPEVRIGRALPPTIRILSPSSGTLEQPKTIVETEVVDQGGGVSQLAIFQNGARLLASGRTRQDGKRLVRTFEVGLIEGENTFEVKAASGDGSWESEPATVVVRYERPLEKSELHLVAVGISKYREPGFRLAHAANDADAMAKLFADRGPTLYAKVNARTLVDQQATRAEILKALQEAAQKTRAQDTLVVFVAGHGVMVGQRYYFLPYEVSPGSQRLEDAFREQALPADTVSEYLGGAKALKRILVLDTCASGGALALVTRSRSSVSLRAAVERLSRSQGLFTIAASAASEEAKESKLLGHGVLTYSLLAALGAAQGGPLEGKPLQPSSADRVVDVLEWFHYADGNARRLSEQMLDSSQDVQMSAIGSSFPVLPVDRSAK